MQLERLFYTNSFTNFQGSVVKFLNDWSRNNEDIQPPLFFFSILFIKSNSTKI